MALIPSLSTHAHRDLERSFANLVDSLARYVEDRVRLALALERDRHDDQIAELRRGLEVAERLAPAGVAGDELEHVRAELAAMAERQTLLTATVADLMLVVDPSGEHSIRAPEQS